MLRFNLKQQFPGMSLDYSNTHFRYFFSGVVRLGAMIVQVGRVEEPLDRVLYRENWSLGRRFENENPGA